MCSLSGKIAVVTGASRGIGRAVALGLASAGCDVAVNYLFSSELAERTAESIRALGRRASVYQADVSVPGQTNAMADAILKDFGKVHILVNNAGIVRDRSFMKLERPMWDDVLKVNLTGPAMLTQRLVKAMIQADWGRVVNVASIVGLTGNFGQANYSAAKGGLIALTKTLARELGGKHLTVNAVAPGFIETDMTRDLPAEVLDNVRQRTPVGRLGRAEEVAAAVVFLASPAASFINGAVLNVSGGLHM